jgi:cytochrome c oxidase subunit 2
MGSWLGLPEVASAHGAALDEINVLVHWLMLVLFVGWAAFFLYLLVRFRRGRSPAAVYGGLQTKAPKWMEGGVAAVEAVLLLAFSIPLWSERVDAFPAEEESTVVRVVGQQFAWNVHYPGPDGVFGDTRAELVNEETNPLGLDSSDPAAADDVTNQNNLYLPVDRPAIVHLSSKDVIHGFMLNEMRTKQDAIPGVSIPAWFEPTVTTAEMRARRISQRYSPRDLERVRDRELYVVIDPGKTDLSAGDLLSEERLRELRDRFGDDGFDARTGAEAIDVYRRSINYEIACAQLCGLGHYRMRGFLHVVTQEEFDAWIDEQVAAKQERPADGFWN